MLINNISVNTRHNRPSVLDRTALVMYFINDGQYADPYQISSVSLFAAANNYYPSSVINADGELKGSASSLVLLNFANLENSDTSSTTFDASNYTYGASGIYRLSQGVYAVVFDTAITSSVFNLSGETVIPNTLSAIGDYMDVWTIRRKEGSDLDTVIGYFTLSEDRFFAVTEPILFRISTRLENNQVTLGSKVDLKFTNEVTLENANIDRGIVNLFKQSIVINPQVEIYKKNDDRNLPARVSVSSFSDTSSLCDVTSENTVIFPLDTRTLSTHPRLLDGTLGSQTGVYVARLRFEALNQVHYTNELAFIIR